ncbi:hypothetical protein FOZ61_005046 [Perkinsus olseni]|uniref:Cas1p 10 TM acyl transferase domain-containing protein n=1 Tax=Perkinsus olseni TaxID=32597 RepID=A0A7J6LID4_PEROL|nr:hypothetical protein FOZ61_005046 [Perkinsus olseni]
MSGVSSDLTLSSLLPTTSLASVFVFGTSALLCLGLHGDEILTWVSVWTGTARYIPVSTKNSSSDVKETDNRLSSLNGSIDSWKQLLLRTTQLGAILLYAFACEWAPLYPHGQREYSRDTFWFLFALFILHSLSWAKTERRPEEAKLVVFGRNNSEELKGWLQFLFLAYHYFHAADVYNMIRVFVSAYVWMTGFGNFSYFYTQNDYSLGRLLSMLWRLNMSANLLCLALNTTYILYYIVPLHTFYFLLTYITMRVFRAANYHRWLMKVKLIVLGLIIYIIWDVDHSWFDAVFGLILPSTATQGAKAGVLYEWHFRSGLDHWSAYLGMIFAYTYPSTAKWMEVVEKLPWKHEWLVKLTVLSALGVLSYSWFTEIHTLSKSDYNDAHPYFFIIPLLTFIYIRNMTPWLRTHYLEPLTRMGKVTLETYLLQHHIWLTENAKKTLVLLPNYPSCNLLLTTAIYVYLANRLFRVTVELRAILLPEKDTATCLKRLLVISAVLITAALLSVVSAALEATAGQIGLTLLILAMAIGRLISCGFSSAAIILPCIGIVAATLALGELPWDASAIMNYRSVSTAAMEPGRAACDVQRGLVLLGAASLMLMWRDPFLVVRPVTYVYTAMVSSATSLRDAYDYITVYGPLHEKYGLPSVRGASNGGGDIEMSVPEMK